MRILLSWGLGIVGALAGAMGGLFLYYYLLPKGYLAIVLPAALPGIGCGLLSLHQSWLRGLLCGFGGLLLAFLVLVTDPQPRHDETFREYVQRIHPPNKQFFEVVQDRARQEQPVILISISIGALIGLWMGRSRISGLVAAGKK